MAALDVAALDAKASEPVGNVGVAAPDFSEFAFNGIAFAPAGAGDVEAVPRPGTLVGVSADTAPPDAGVLAGAAALGEVAFVEEGPDVALVELGADAPTGFAAAALGVALGVAAADGEVPPGVGLLGAAANLAANVVAAPGVAALAGVGCCVDAAAFGTTDVAVGPAAAALVAAGAAVATGAEFGARLETAAAAVLPVAAGVAAAAPAPFAAMGLVTVAVATAAVFAVAAGAAAGAVAGVGVVAGAGVAAGGVPVAVVAHPAAGLRCWPKLVVLVWQQPQSAVVLGWSLDLPCAPLVPWLV